MDFPHGHNPDSTVLIVGSGTRYPSFYPLVLKYKYIIGGLNSRATYKYIDSCLSDMRNYILESPVDTAIIAVPKHFLGDVVLFVKHTKISNILIYDSASGDIL